MNHEPLKGLPLALMTFGVGLGTFIQVLDLTVVNVVVPEISGELGASVTQGTWAITAFTVSNAIVLPLSGWLSNRYGSVRLFVWSLFLFSFISLFCAMSVTLPMLVFFRALQGGVAGSLIPISQSLLLLNYPEKKKGLALGLWGLIVMIAPALGPILGGWLTDNYGWGWVFFINVPVGIVAGIVTWMLLKDRETPREKLPVDILGFVLFAMGIACLQILLDKGNELDWFRSDVIRALAVIVVVSLSYFILWELDHPHPIIDLTLFKGRNFTIGTFLCSLMAMVFFGGTLILPLWLQVQMGYTAYLAGLTLAPIGYLSVILFPLVGFMLHKLDLRIWIAMSFILFAISFFWYSGFTTQVSFLDVGFPRYIQGAAVSLFFIPLTAISLLGIEPKRLPSAAGVFTFMRYLLISFGFSLSVYLWQRRETIHQSHLVEVVLPTRQATMETLQTFQSLGLNEQASDQGLLNMLVHQAYMLATNDVFWLFGWLSVILLPPILLLRPKKKEEATQTVLTD